MYVEYVEYVTAAMEPRPGIRGDDLYMDPVTFRRDHHDQSVRKIFDEVLVGTKDTPALTPTRFHTHDFNLTYRGARLMDGECKLNTKTEDESVLVLHSANQLAYKDTALAILSTNTCFQFFSSRKNIAGGMVLTSVCETKKFKLGSITDISVDSDEGTEWLRAPPSFLITDNGKNTVFVEEDKHILEIWSEQRSEVKSFVYALVQSLDLLVQAVTDMKIRKVGGTCTAAFHKGAKEPGFLPTNVPDLKT